MVKHLGLQMYSGAVPSIAELVANAWDADAHHVWLELPLDAPLDAKTEIVVRDDGTGMSFDQVNDNYLRLGRDRRAVDGDHTAGNRPVLGRKGIGKLAGFGVAKLIEVWTVRDGHLTGLPNGLRQDHDRTVGASCLQARGVA